MLTAKELMQLEDFLTMQECYGKTLEHFANEVQDQQGKQFFQQTAQKCRQNFQSISKHLNSGQTLQ